MKCEHCGEKPPTFHVVYIPGPQGFLDFCSSECFDAWGKDPNAIRWEEMFTDSLENFVPLGWA